jgi:hypothetical protein
MVISDRVPTRGERFRDQLAAPSECHRSARPNKQGACPVPILVASQARPITWPANANWSDSERCGCRKGSSLSKSAASRQFVALSAERLKERMARIFRVSTSYWSGSTASNALLVAAVGIDGKRGRSIRSH